MSTVDAAVATIAGVPTGIPSEADVCCAGGVESPLAAAAAARYAALLKALADPHRLRILALLGAQPAADPLCVCDVETAFDLSQPTISHHLRVLREAGLVTVTKRGLWHYYALAPDGLQPVQALLAGLARPARVPA